MKKILALVLAIVLIASAVGCTGTDSSNASNSTPASTASGASATDSSAAGESSAATPAGTGMYPGTADPDSITINISQEPPKMNTILSTDTVSHQVQNHIFQMIVGLDENDQVVPGAAEKWDVSEDGLTYTFHLREGMKWSNGDPVTANDFAFAWQQLLNPELASEYAYFGYIFENGEKYYNGEAKWEDVGVKAIDEKTLEIKLVYARGFVLHLLSTGNFAPVNEKFYNEVGAEAYATETEFFCTNGAYKVENWTHNSEFVIVKNEEFWDAANVNIPKIKMAMITDTTAAFNAFKAGELDMVGLNGDQRAMILEEGYTLKNYEDGSSWCIAFNTTNEILKNANLRRAIGWAIDKETFVSAILKNDSRAATGWTHPGISGLNGSFAEEVGSALTGAGDVDKAKEYLDKALTELNVKVEDIKLTMIIDEGDQAAKNAAYIQEQLKSKLGLVIETESMPFKNRLDRQTQKDYEISLYGWSADYNDPISFLDLWETKNGNNITGYSSETYDANINGSVAETDPAKRMEMLVNAEKEIIEEMPIAPFYWRARDYVTSEKVTGEIRSLFQDWNFKSAKLVK